MILDLTSRAIRGWDRAAVLTRTWARQAARSCKATFLMFHSVGGLGEAEYVARWGVPSITAQQFRKTLSFFARRGFRAITVSEFARRSLQDRIEPRTLVLTFDDGFKDNYSIAAPILQELGLTATFYAVCGWVGRPTPAWLHRAAWHLDRDMVSFAARTRRLAGDRWDAFFRLFRPTGHPGRDALLVFRQALRPVEQRAVLDELARRHGYPPSVPLYMDWRELADLSRAGMEIGAHTVTHRSLWTLPPAVAAREIARSKRAIEQRLGVPVTTFSYPFGHYLPAHLRMIEKAGFRAAVTVRGHGNDATTPLLELGRHGIRRDLMSRYALGRIALDRTEDPTARLNRRLGRHLGRTIADPKSGMLTFTAQGVAYDPTPAAILLQGGDT